MMSDGELTEPERGPNVTLTQHVSVTQQILRTESELAPDYQMVTYWPYENTGNGRWNKNIGFLPGYVFPDSIVFANICELTAWEDPRSSEQPRCVSTILLLDTTWW